MNDDLLTAYERLLNEQAKLLTEYRKFLEHAGGDDDGELRYLLKKHRLFFPHVVIENQCPLASAERNRHMHLMVDNSKSKVGHQHLSEFTQDASDLIIVDPYLFPKTGKCEEHTKRFLDMISLKKTQRIHVVVDKRKLSSELYDNVQQELSKSNIEITKHETDKIHDRIWIKNISAGKDCCRAKVVGTSLNGLGSKAAFILDLPHDDLTAIINFMGQHRLLGPLQDQIHYFA